MIVQRLFFENLQKRHVYPHCRSILKIAVGTIIYCYVGALLHHFDLKHQVQIEQPNQIRRQ
jgi:hypothetical protein